MLALDASGAIVGGNGRGVQTLALPLRNPAVLHRHGPSGALLVACAGDRKARAGGVQRLVEHDDGSIGLGVFGCWCL